MQGAVLLLAPRQQVRADDVVQPQPPLRQVEVEQQREAEELADEIVAVEIVEIRCACP